MNTYKARYRRNRGIYVIKVPEEFTLEVGLVTE